MVLDKVVNLKEFWWPNKEIKYFSRTSTEFKVLSRQLPKFKTCWRLYKPWLFLLWCFLARTKHNCCLWCMIEFNCTKVCKPMKDHERVAVAAEFWPLPVISLLLFFILLVKLKAGFNNIKIISNLIRTTKFSKVSINCQNSMAKWLYFISIISNFNVTYYVLAMFAGICSIAVTLSCWKKDK